MIRKIVCFAAFASVLPMCAQNQSKPAAPAAASATKPAAQPEWITISNGYANMLIHVVFQHHPEFGSQQGLAQYDTKVSQPTLADEDRERKETEAVLAKLQAAAAQKQQEEVAEDLQIMIRRVNLDFKRQDFRRANEVPFYNASQVVFSGVRLLLDDQTPEARHPAAVVRVREYAGLEPGYTAITEILKQRTQEQMAKPGVIYPAKVEIETEMARNSNYVEGLAALLTKQRLEGWQEPLGKLK